MAERKQVKLRKTAAGAQQIGSVKDWKALKNRFEKDMAKVLDGNMTKDEFKKKYGKTVGETQKMIYKSVWAAKAMEAEKNPKYKGHKKDMDETERYFDSMDKKLKGYAYGGMAKKKAPMKGYNKGGYAKCGASNPAKRKAK